MLQVLADTLWATRGEYPQSGPNIRGNRPERVNASNPTCLSSVTNTSGFSWPRLIKALTSFLAQLRAETQNNMGSIMHKGQNRERIFNLTSLKQSKSQYWFIMDETRWTGTSDTWNQPSTKVYYLYKHGMGNNLHIESLYWS